jgi:hypothetical protein
MKQKSAKDLVAEASREVETLSGEDALKLLARAWRRICRRTRG